MCSQIQAWLLPVFQGRGGAINQKAPRPYRANIPVALWMINIYTCKVICTWRWWHQMWMHFLDPPLTIFQTLRLFVREPGREQRTEEGMRKAWGGLGAVWEWVQLALSQHLGVRAWGRVLWGPSNQRRLALRSSSAVRWPCPPAQSTTHDKGPVITASILHIGQPWDFIQVCCSWVSRGGQWCNFL